MLRILHTADWHLGRSLYRRQRYHEFEAFLNWLEATIIEQEIDVLLVAGDVFDNTTPGTQSQSLYYSFLHRVRQSGCRHVVITSGNHDSPSFLDAPRDFLHFFDVQVVGRATDDPADEVLVLEDAAGKPELIVCAVPFLRDRDVRISAAGETADEKERSVVDGIHAHYAAVTAEAVRRREALGVDVPIVAMGHLFAQGGRTEDGDGVRELYVGSLGRVTADMFADELDYVALGHLHVPQVVGGREHVRYSGSPIPMGFGEAGQQKIVCLVEVGSAVSVEKIPVPVFQRLARLRGDLAALTAQLTDLIDEGVSVWCEVEYTGDEIVGTLREQLEEHIAGTNVELLRVKNNRIIASVLAQTERTEQLADITPEQVFERCLETHDIPAGQRGALRDMHQEILHLVQAGPDGDAS